MNNVESSENNTSGQRIVDESNQSFLDVLWTALFLRGSLMPPFGEFLINQIIQRRDSEEIQRDSERNNNAQDQDVNQDDRNQDTHELNEDVNSNDERECQKMEGTSSEETGSATSEENEGNMARETDNSPDNEPTIEEAFENLPSPDFTDEPGMNTPPRTRTILMIYHSLPSRENSEEVTGTPPPPRQIMRVMFVMDSSMSREDTGFEGLLNRLLEMHQPTASPTCQDFVNNLPQREVNEENKVECPSCTVCFDEFEVGSSASYLPCRHQFHQDCITPWLSQHNTCPVCRFALPTASASC